MCLSIHLSIYLSTCLSIYLSIHPSIHPNPSIYRVLIRSSYSEIETSTAPTALTQQTRNTWRNLAHPSDASPSRSRRSVFFSQQQRAKSSAGLAMKYKCWPATNSKCWMAIVRSEKTHTLTCNEFRLVMWPHTLTCNEFRLVMWLRTVRNAPTDFRVEGF